ncbi:MAG: phosphoribosylanthranilate isomerase [Bosea sp. (in: a-proteobacteria)]|uniref:phosphoribosylanthranilate isomerase n=1 Tax=Bosea sp. (in: a-proteobacteria) TaxID=1871050 RepID=UPI00273554EA|nr:phosphoribosylanthranilate isomerase [Bosea sp. (in: a-proteobacteria)]MDP3257638.1 phosphoribosylanthranilate isomerase [Bosea sp. (in: a-proteobacteria)]MDP3319173.1 phosphoribosylanthranilate isomerase [Bosea sp. (in: a-proteobacteria)]
MSVPAQPLAIKICGLSTPETLEAALAAGVEMIGLVFHPKSPRFVQPKEAAALAALARGRAEIVALIVDRAIGEVTELVEAVRPDWLQLHGRETPEAVRAVKAATGLRAIKALGVADRHDLAALAAYDGIADRILLDAKPPKDAAYPGGHGRAFDWSILAALDRASPFMLSGGLDPANVAQAITMARPWGVDVSSGVERAPGVKDVDRIRDFVVAARAAAAAATEAGRT